MPLRLALAAMGTRFELVLVPDEGDHSGVRSPRVSGEARLRAIGEEAFEEIREAEARLSLFDRSSLLSHVNRNAGAGWVRVDGDTFELLELCRRVYEDTNGAFDPTVARLMEARGFHAEPGHGLPALDVDAAREAASFAAVELDSEGSRLRFTRPDVALDLGGIAKGHGLDLAAQVLVDHEVTTSMIHGGTSGIHARGTPPRAGHEGWRIALFLQEGAPAREVDLIDEVLSISDIEGRKNKDDSGHVLDPRNGESVSATHKAIVRAPFTSEPDSTRHAGALCDAWTTALLVDPSLSVPPPLTGEVTAPLAPPQGPLP